MNELLMVVTIWNVVLLAILAVLFRRSWIEHKAQERELDLAFKALERKVLDTMQQLAVAEAVLAEKEKQMSHNKGQESQEIVWLR